jgi:hypothetical protein
VDAVCLAVNADVAEVEKRNLLVVVAKTTNAVRQITDIAFPEDSTFYCWFYGLAVLF